MTNTNQIIKTTLTDEQIRTLKYADGYHLDSERKDGVLRVVLYQNVADEVGEIEKGGSAFVRFLTDSEFQEIEQAN